jgi:hypothetical protein
LDDGKKESVGAIETEAPTYAHPGTAKWILLYGAWFLPEKGFTKYAERRKAVRIPPERTLAAKPQWP